MARIDDRSATATPRQWIALAVVLLVARVVASGIDLAHPAATPQGVQWHDIPSFHSTATVANKLIIYEFYANWCDPCKRMEHGALSNRQIKELIEGRFVPLRVTDYLKEHGKNPQYVTDLQKRYRIFAFPTLVVVGADGEPVGSLVGCCSSLTTYRFLSRVLNSQSIKAVGFKSVGASI